MSDVEIREATEDDLLPILETLRAALGETPLLTRTPELWNWKHVINPFGRSIVLVGLVDGLIAGVRALMSWKLETPDGDVISCMRAVDTATHPDFTRRGIFRALTEAAIEAARQRGVHLIFNTPNARSGPGYMSIGWSEVGHLGLQIRPLFRLSRAIPRNEVPRIDYLAPSVSNTGPLSTDSRQRTPRGLRTLRTQEYLNWRFSEHPTASYGWRLDDRGAFVFRASRRGPFNELVLSDVLGAPSRSEMTRALHKTRAHYVAGWFSPGSPERSIAIRSGVVPIPGRKTLRLVARPLADLPLDPLNLDNWDVATSDFELL
jgi:GNAT superfamily N-acetyltransferase